MIKRFLPIPGSVFLNDIAVDSKGIFYISDSSSKNSKIYCFNGEKTYIWLSGKEIQNPNGLFIENNSLYVGNSGNGIIKKINIDTKKLTDFITVGRGIDGLKLINNNCFITSDWQGTTAMACNSKITTLLDTTKEKINAADLEYLPKLKLIIIPTFFNNNCTAYRLEF